MLMLPSVTMNEFRPPSVTNRPLPRPMTPPAQMATITPNQIFSPAPSVSATTTPAKPATAATERSSPPAMISGVPAAAISPMNAMLVPMLAMLSKVRNQRDSTENRASTST